MAQTQPAVSFDMPHLSTAQFQSSSDDHVPDADVRVDLQMCPFPGQPCSYRYEGISGALDLRRPSLSTVTLPPAQMMLSRKTAAGSQTAPMIFNWSLNDPETSGFHTKFPSEAGVSDSSRPSQAQKPKFAPSKDVVHQTSVSKNILELLSPVSSNADRGEKAGNACSCRSLVSACCSQTFTVFSVTATPGGAEAATSDVASEQVLGIMLNRRCTAHRISLLAAVASDDSRTPISTGSRSPFRAAPASRKTSLACVFEPIVLLGLHGGDILVHSVSQDQFILRFNSSYSSTAPQAVQGSAVATIAELQSSVAQCMLRTEVLYRSTEALTASGVPLETAAQQHAAMLECTAVFAAGFDNGQVLVFSVSAEKGAVLRVLDAIGSSPVMCIAVLGKTDVFGCLRMPSSSSSFSSLASSVSSPFIPQLEIPERDGKDNLYCPSPVAVATMAAVACKSGQVVFVTVDTFTEIGSIGGDDAEETEKNNQPERALGEIYHLAWLPSQAGDSEWALAAVGVDDKLTIFGVRHLSTAVGPGSPVPPLQDASPSRSSQGRLRQPVPRLCGTITHRFALHRSWTCHVAEWILGRPPQSSRGFSSNALVCCSYDRSWSMWLLCHPPQDEKVGGEGLQVGGTPSAGSSSSLTLRRASITGRTPQSLRPSKASSNAFSRPFVALDEPLVVVAETCGPDDMILRCAAIQDVFSDDGRQLLVTLSHKCRLATWKPLWAAAPK
jgi:hypothetical protein